MVKKALLGTALGTGALFLVFGTSAPSYVKTAFCRLRQSAKEAVNPQFEIERARQDIESLKPMFDQNKETLARAEVEAEHLDREIGTITANLETAKKTILALQHNLKTGDFRLAGHSPEAAIEVKSELAHRLDHFDYTSDLLRQKQEVLKAKRKIIQAAHQQLENLKTQKTTLLAKLANIEARLQMIEATQSKNDFNFDNSALSRAKQTISELEQRLDVMARRAEIEGRYGDLDQPSSYVDPHRDVVKEVDEKFGPESRSAKPGDKTL
jgi:predicted  nucleic acid-binding Zn-ribbon protein